MGHYSSSGVGQYAASERHILIADRSYRGDGTRPGVIYCPSHGNDATQALAVGYTDAVVYALAEAGYPVLAVDAGGGTAWGNDTAISRVNDAKAYLQGTLGAKAGGVFFYCFSMGALSALNWARTHAGSVLGAVFACPAVDLQDIHDNRGYGAEIDAAYGGSAAYLAALSTHSPVLNGAAFTFPIQVWYGDQDTSAVPSTVKAFSAASQASLVPMVGGGHDPRPVVPRDAVAFLAAHAA